MLNRLSNPLALAGRILIALMFVPAGFQKIGGFAGTVGYAAFFTLLASFFFHAYWSVPADAAMMQQLLFWKNIAVTGGLLGFAAHGAGGWSVDARRH
jgi:putative oxidoreductase